jgi:O-acetylhomoserine (thiol)-lyase
MGGAIVDSGRFDWRTNAPRFPMFCEPDESYHGLVYVDRFGPEAFVARARAVYQRTTGAVLAPMSAFLLLQGIETLAVRMERHVENARAVAHFLRGDPRIEWVDYVGFPDHPHHTLALKYLRGRAPSLLTLGVVGGLEAAKAFYDALELVKRLVNIGDTRTLCCHPASTTHRQMTAQELERAGVRAETIRLCVGIEHVEDIIEDLDRALGAAARLAPAIAAQ